MSIELTSGELIFDGKPLHLKSPAEALAHGIAMVFQETNLVPSMSVAQNIYLGEEQLFNRLRGLYIQAQRFLLSLNFYVDPMALVSTLGAGKKQMVEIARAVHHHARVLIFDEPTASLTPEEKFHFFNLVRRLQRDGMSVIFISHALEEALTLSDRITVLRDGEVGGDGCDQQFRSLAACSRDGRPEFVERALRAAQERKTRPYGEEILSVRNLSMGSIVRNTSFSVFSGQITGMFGLVGAGRTETMKMIAGVLKRDFFHGGEVRLKGRRVRYRTPRPAVVDGIVYVTEDRKVEGFFETMSIAQNIQVGELTTGENPLELVTMGQARQMANEWTKRLGVRAIDPARGSSNFRWKPAEVVIAKSLVQKPKLVIFDEPTRGVDVGAIVEIHRFINELATAASQWW